MDFDPLRERKDNVDTRRAMKSRETKDNLEGDAQRRRNEKKVMCVLQRLTERVEI